MPRAKKRLGKRGALTKLWDQIERDARTWRRPVWRYPRSNGCAGWTGTGPIFCSLIPGSRGAHGMEYEVKGGGVLFFYRHLLKYGFRNAHLTDAVKLRAANDDAPALLRKQKLLNQSKAWFLKEVQILHPRLIVAVGQKAFRLLRLWLPDDNRLHSIPHYSWAFRWKKTSRFRRAMADLLL